MAVADVPKVKIESIGLRPFHEFDEANDTWPRGDRPAAIREAAAEFRARFATQDNQVRAVRTVDIASAGYPLKFAFGGAARGPNPYVNIINRLQVVQFEDFEGRLRTLAYEPTVPEGPAEAPYYAQQIEKLGEFLSYKVLATIWNHPDEALLKAGLRPEDVDYVSFDHLHVQDLRFVLGTTEPIPGEAAPRPPLFPNAKLVAQRKEWDTFASLHPMQWAWYVKDGIKDLVTDNVVLVDGDVELGKGVALVWTPGHTDGNHSLCINTEEGVWVSSENGVAADSWHPHLSKIPGVRKTAEFFGREVILNSNTLEDSIDQYDSMIKEKALADPHPRDPRYLQIFPSSEMADWKRQWPVVPTFWYGGIAYGRIERPE
jgi:hypothetical protein